MAKVQTNEAMVGKRIKLEDGSRVKIAEAQASGYKLSNGDRLPARKVEKRGRSFIETDLTMRDLEDTGEGYVVKPGSEEASPKKSATRKKTTGKKKTTSKKKEETGRTTRNSKTKSKSKTKDSEEKRSTRKTKTTRSKKKDEAPSSKKTVSRRRTKAKESKPETKPARSQEIELKNKPQLEKIQTAIRLAVGEILAPYTNIDSQNTCLMADPSKSAFSVTIGVKTSLVKPEHHSLSYYKAIAKEAGARIITLKPNIQAKIAERLEPEESVRDSFVLEYGDILLDEDGTTKLVYSGVNVKESKFVLVNMSTEQVIEIGLSGFDSLDTTGVNVASLGMSIEEYNQELESAADVDDDEFAIDSDEDKTPLESLDWDNTDHETLVDLLSDVYTEEELIAFAEQMDASEEELEAPISELIEMIVAAQKEESEDFEDADEEPESDELELGDIEMDEDDLETEDDLDLEDAEDLDGMEEVVENKLSIREMAAALVESGDYTPKGLKRLSDDEIEQEYQDLIGDQEEEAEELPTLEEMKETLVSDGQVTPKGLKRMEDEEIERLYIEVYGDEVEDDQDDVDMLFDADSVEEADDLELEGEDEDEDLDLEDELESEFE